MKTSLAASAMAVMIHVASPAQAADADPPAASDSWRGPDKTLHFGVSMALGAASRGLLPRDPWMAVGVALAPGLIKEFADKRFSR